MKTQVLRTSIFALLLAVAGHAQSSQPLRATIPFNFIAGPKTLPPGPYTVNQSSTGLITLKSPVGKANGFLFAPATDCPGNQSTSRLTFHRYGTTYVLSEIWTGGNDCGRKTPVTSRERELVRKYSAPDETVVVAAR